MTIVFNISGSPIIKFEHRKSLTEINLFSILTFSNFQSKVVFAETETIFLSSTGLLLLTKKKLKIKKFIFQFSLNSNKNLSSQKFQILYPISINCVKFSIALRADSIPQRRAKFPKGGRCPSPAVSSAKQVIHKYFYQNSRDPINKIINKRVFWPVTTFVDHYIPLTKFMTYFDGKLVFLLNQFRHGPCHKSYQELKWKKYTV